MPSVVQSVDEVVVVVGVDAVDGVEVEVAVVW
jgi:hypothetical protein